MKCDALDYLNLLLVEAEIKASDDNSASGC